MNLRRLSRLIQRWADQSMRDAADHWHARAQAAEAQIQEQTRAARAGARVLNVAATDLEEATAVIKELRGELEQKDQQIERQADQTEKDRTEREQLRRDLRHEKCASESRARITHAARALRRQAEQERDQAIKERDGALARVVELENTIVAMAAASPRGAARNVLDEAWGDVIGAGVDGRGPR